MRREKNNFTSIIIALVVVSVLVAILIGVLISKGVNTLKENNFANQMSKLNEDLSETDSVSTQIGKNVIESEKEIDIEENKKEEYEEEYETPKLNTNAPIAKTNNKNTTTKEKSNGKKEIEKKANNEISAETNSKLKKEEKIEFEAPIKGEILKEFAKDSLVYSNTLQEWVTHNGLDIKADKTTVVKAAAKGTVSAIKNDPRYGLTVIITHDDGYQTVYSNLLTAEFVVKGEKVEKGQSLGTVGNSASFEIADEYHLHFELLKDNEYINPTTYINFE